MCGFWRVLFLPLLLVTLPVAAGDTAFAPATDGARIIYREVTLIDGTAAPPRPDMAVIVRGDGIEARSPTSPTCAP